MSNASEFSSTASEVGDLVAVLAPPLLAWLALLLGVVPYLVRWQRTGEGHKVVVRALFWSLAIGAGGQFSQGRTWLLWVPALEGVHSLIGARRCRLWYIMPAE